jgi:type IV pilus assembly protein PilV
MMQAITLRVLSRSYKDRANGFTLIEALIAFVILAVGLLGIISLILMAKNTQHQAIQRTRAVNLADAIVERIRINPAGIAVYATYDNTSPVGDGSLGGEPAPNCRSASCSPAELAAHDVWAWEQALIGAAATIDGENVEGLLDPQGCITFDAATGLTGSGELRVDIQWRGLVESTDAVQAGEDTCGGEAAGNDPFRRKVSVRTLIVDEAEL